MNKKQLQKPRKMGIRGDSLAVFLSLSFFLVQTEAKIPALNTSKLTWWWCRNMNNYDGSYYLHKIGCKEKEWAAWRPPT